MIRSCTVVDEWSPLLSGVFAAPHPDQWVLDLCARLREPLVVVGWGPEPAPGGLPAGLPSLLSQPDGPGARAGAPKTKHLTTWKHAYIHTYVLFINVFKAYSHIFQAGIVAMPLKTKRFFQ